MWSAALEHPHHTLQEIPLMTSCLDCHSFGVCMGELGWEQGLSQKPSMSLSLNCASVLIDTTTKVASLLSTVRGSRDQITGLLMVSGYKTDIKHAPAAAGPQTGQGPWRQPKSGTSTWPQVAARTPGSSTAHRRQRGFWLFRVFVRCVRAVVCTVLRARLPVASSPLVALKK